MVDLLQIDVAAPAQHPDRQVVRKLPEWLTVRLPKRRPIEEVQELMRSE
jgi:lipoate synthase